MKAIGRDRCRYYGYVIETIRSQTQQQVPRQVKVQCWETIENQVVGGVLWLVRDTLHERP